MKNKHKIVFAFISTILVTLLALPAYAQSQGLVTAEVDRNELTTDEYFTLSVITNLDGGAPYEPALPPLDGFELIGTSTSTNMSIINGVQNTQKVFMYTLHPTIVGEHIIGPISVTLNGQTYHTSPIKIIVTQGNGQPPSQPRTPSSPPTLGFPSIPGFPSISGLLNSFGFDIPIESDVHVEQLDPSVVPPDLLQYDYLVEAQVDNPLPYLGEQVTYTFRYYRPAESVGMHSYGQPDFTGFWVHPESEETQYGTQVAGRNFRMTEIKTLLFPTVIGEVEIQPAIITAEGDIYSRDFTIQTLPETIDVQPLPAGAPNSFSGAIGNFSITAGVDTKETKVNDAVTLNIIVSGEGNLDTFSDPEWGAGSEWRAFDSQAMTNIQNQDGKLVGTRTIEQVLVPTKSGNYTIPSIQFSYFDPQRGTYQTTSTQPIEITIESDGGASAPVTTGLDNSPDDVTAVTGGIRPIKLVPDSGGISTLLTQQSGYWLLWILPLFLLIGQYGWIKRKENLLSNPEARRSQKAAKQAFQALKRVDINSDEYYSEGGRILTTYLSEKLNHFVVGLTQAELSDLLLTNGIDSDLVEQAQNCLTISEMGKFAPINQSNTGELKAETKSLIAKLDNQLKKNKQSRGI